MAAVAAVCAVCVLSAPASADEFATRDEAVALVKKAIARVQEVGIDKAKAEFMDHGGAFVDCDLYLIVLDEAGVRIAHGQNPKLVGTSYYDSVDANGDEYGKAAAKIVAGPGSGWVSYLFKDPITGRLLPKSSYIEKAGGCVYIAGVYAR
jgi:cytochrome c